MSHLVLVPLDGSKISESAIPTALVVARRWNACLEIITTLNKTTDDLGGSRRIIFPVLTRILEGGHEICFHKSLWEVENLSGKVSKKC